MFLFSYYRFKTKEVLIDAFFIWDDWIHEKIKFGVCENLKEVILMWLLKNGNERYSGYKKWLQLNLTQEE